MVQLRIEALGHQGDGLASDGEAQVYVPFTLPGDVVEAAVSGSRGTVRRLIEPAPARIEPACRHFGACGGCAIQHMAQADYLGWKRRIVVDAMASRGFADVPVRETVAVPPGSRRRAKLKAVRRGRKMQLGFSERASHAITELEECPVLTPRLQAFVTDPGDLARHIRRADFYLLDTETGIDLDIEPFWKSGVEQLGPLPAWAKGRGIARLTSQGYEIARHAEPVIHLSGVAVVPPPRAFLQPTVEGEAALCDLVREAVGDAARVADLFAGLGTFTFALAGRARIHGVEGDEAMASALQTAARKAQSLNQGLKEITIEVRDLFRRPLLPAELKRYDAVVFDPPRAGAAAQAEVLAQSAVPRIAAVSCNPATFARDARTLVDGGYRLHHITPVDQFVWSAHVELVGFFSKG